jgi:organic hydroperoxide reductase OsmC/OhrA
MGMAASSMARGASSAVTHGCAIEWTRGDAVFTDNQYSRAHRWRFDGGAVVPGSSSPHSVRVPWSDPAAVDPEEALVAAVASCHMLWFLSLAAQAGWVVESYTDEPQGCMGRFADGHQGITQVLLRPQVVIAAGPAGEHEAMARLHHAAHERCDIAHSIRGEVRVEGTVRRVAAR